MSRLETIAVGDIVVAADRARGLDQAWVEGLAAIIDAEGLIQPIAVQVNLDGYNLVAGGHRLAACTALGWEQIPAVIYDDGFESVELIETLENLARRELSALDRAKHFARFKVGYEAKHGPIKVGRPGGTAGNSPRDGQFVEGDIENQSAPDAPWSFHEVIAERTGFKRASIFDYLAIWNGLAPDSYERICALEGLAENKGQLKQLSEQSHERQEEVLGLIETYSKINSVGDALSSLAGIEPKPASEKKFSAALGAVGRLNQDQRYAIFDAHEADVRAYAAQRGWIDG